VILDLLTVGKAIKKVPVVVGNCTGFAVNRTFFPYTQGAQFVASLGVDVFRIDRVISNFGMPMGPVELADRVGLDICLAVANKLAPYFNLKIPEQLEQMVQENRLGAKTGSGFYNYKNGKASYRGVEDSSDAPTDLTNRLICRLLNESVACLREQIVDNADLLDAGVIFGTGFAPFCGGPMHYINSTGVEQQHKRLKQLEQIHGERFKPDSEWNNLHKA
jgi:3-hydroxyacyl-CoA dehydrogenase/enoyl-CoA hydratase/3-hydroxybutyryl-CoA epimerase